MYVFEREATLPMIFINNLKLPYKFIDANQKILKQKEKKSPFICFRFIVRSIIQINSSVLMEANPMLENECHLVSQKCFYKMKRQKWRMLSC